MTGREKKAEGEEVKTFGRIVVHGCVVHIGERADDERRRRRRRRRTTTNRTKREDR